MAYQFFPDIGWADVVDYGTPEAAQAALAAEHAQGFIIPDRSDPSGQQHVSWEEGLAYEPPVLWRAPPGQAPAGGPVDTRYVPSAPPGTGKEIIIGGGGGGTTFFKPPPITSPPPIVSPPPVVQPPPEAGGVKTANQPWWVGILPWDNKPWSIPQTIADIFKRNPAPAGGVVGGLIQSATGIDPLLLMLLMSQSGSKSSMLPLLLLMSRR